MTDAATSPALNPWQPETDSLSLAILGKLAEELGEGSAAVARCIIQGIDEREPVTGKLNREWLEDELADIEAQIAVAKARFLLDGDRMAQRTARKVEHVRSWHKMIGSNR